MFMDDPKPKACWNCGSNRTSTVMYAQNDSIVVKARCLDCNTALVRKATGICSLNGIVSLVDDVNGAWNHKATKDSDIGMLRMPIFRIEVLKKHTTNHLRWKEF